MCIRSPQMFESHVVYSVLWSIPNPMVPERSTALDLYAVTRSVRIARSLQCVLEHSNSNESQKAGCLGSVSGHHKCSNRTLFIVCFGACQIQWFSRNQMAWASMRSPLVFESHAVYSVSWSIPIPMISKRPTALDWCAVTRTAAIERC